MKSHTVRMRSLLLPLFLLSLGGCTTMRVTSDPPDANVVWSRDGLEPYLPWPPNSWEWDTSSSNATPFRSRGSFGDTVFVTVEKEGFRRPLPQPVELYFLRSEKLHFDLAELPETYAARMREEGYLLYHGEWVDPEELGLVEYEGVVMKKEDAFRLEQSSRGLVEYEGEWITPAEAEERQLAERTAAGYIQFKDRWVMPEVRDHEVAIDEEVAAISEAKVYHDFPAPKVLGSFEQPAVQIQLYNSTGQRVRFLFSGAVSREFAVDPYRSVGVRNDDRIVLPSGRYDIAVVPTGLDAAGRDLTQLLGRVDQATALQLTTEPQFASWPLASNRQYSFNFTGGQRDLQEDLQEFTPPEPSLDFTPPTIEIPEVQLPAPQERPRRGPEGPGTNGPPAEGQRPQRPEGGQRPQQGERPQRPEGGGQRPPQPPPAPTQ